ncbi:hypothetical protein X755_20995 [Mesorhizobium sp. LNJC405B00]|nr:hypothetical protein X755_20995 [Mesorhizobium sp. LNJC405B00]
MTAVSREELDAKLSASEARIDGTLGRIEETLRHMPSTSYLLTSAVASTLAVMGLLVALLAFGGDRFSGGVEVGVASVDRKLGIDRLSTENVQQSKDIQDLSKKMDTVIESVKALQTYKPPPE